MKSRRSIGAFVVVGCLVVMEAAFAESPPLSLTIGEGGVATGAPIVATFYENCTAVINGVNVTCTMEVPYEISGASEFPDDGSVLVPTYPLAPQKQQACFLLGDIVLQHADGSASDVIRGVPDPVGCPGPWPGTKKIQFFSDAPGPKPSDVGLPTPPNYQVDPSGLVFTPVFIVENPSGCTDYLLATPHRYTFCSTEQSFVAPAVSTWGVVALLVITITGIAFKFGRRQAVT